VSEFAAGFAKGGRLHLENKNGSIRISGQETAECRIKATVEVKAGSERKRNELMEDVKLEVKPEKGGASVDVEHRKLRWGESVRVDFEITVPKQASVELANGNGDIDISDIAGDIEAATGNGFIGLDETDGDVKLSVGNGKVTLDETEFGKCKVSVGNGKITGKGISGDIKFTVGHGSVKVSYAKNAHGAINAEVELGMGGIDFRGPDGLSAEVEATTAMGSIDTALPLKRSKDMMAGTVRGTVGKGEGKVKLATSMGSIKIE
jgi:DUF4097 and DUF4098 domain-containing protein YvlB